MNARVPFLRRWWPTLALVALGLLSAGFLRNSHVKSRELLQQTIASLDNISESRRRLFRAYLIHDRQSAGDATFDRSSATAEARAAEYALENWFHGRSGIVTFRGTRPVDGELRRLGASYQEALSRFRVVLIDGEGDMVHLRRSFSAADEAAGALEAAIHSAVRESLRAKERAHRVRLAGWGVLLLVSVLGATYTRRALKESETQRVDTESRLARLQAIAPVGIVECDLRGRVVAANPMWCSLTGRSEREWVGRRWWDALNESDREAARRLWKRHEDSPQVTTQARLDAGETGSEPTWLLVRVGDAGASGSIRDRRVVTFTDITYQRTVEDQLHHVQRMEAIGQLAGGVAHDFNNLLTSIRGFATLALDAAVGEEALTEDLREIERAADRGRALTRQLLTFSRQDRIDPKVVDAGVVVRELYRMLDRLVPDTVEIRTAVEDGPATVLIDQGQLEQVITNLVVNAADAMAGRGVIRIAVGTVQVEETFQGAKSDIEPGSYVLLAVSDNGPGIPPGVRERIFEPFFTTKEQGKGTGLGLSTVWAIVRQSGGHIHLYTTSSQGTVFKIYLPMTAEAPSSRERPADAPPAKPQAMGVAMVVEDEEAVRRLTCRVLERAGWTVLVAGTGDEALRILEQREEPVDLLVTDLTMPGMGGVELVAQLRERGIEVPTLFVSGFAASEVELGGAHFLEKPFTPGALIRRVNEVAAAGQSG